jgi:hypothetical protein
MLDLWGRVSIVSLIKLTPTEGRFLMAQQTGRLTAKNFWWHAFTKSLNVRGRLALAFLIFHVEDDNIVVLEDMAMFTGLDMSECRDWLRHFMQQGYIRPEVRWEED